MSLCWCSLGRPVLAAVVTMGCGDACATYPGKRYLDWELTDPAGKSVEEVRPIRDEIDRRVRAEELARGVKHLLRSICQAGPGTSHCATWRCDVPRPALHIGHGTCLSPPRAWGTNMLDSSESAVTNSLRLSSSADRNPSLGDRALSCLRNHEVPAHACAVVTGQVADERVMALRELKRDPLRLTGRHVSGLADVGPRRVLVDPVRLALE